VPGRIILISMDTVGAGHVSVTGKLDTTPVLRDIASQGWIFRRAYAAANYTIPAHMSMFTGLDPTEHGVHRMFATLHPDVPTLASILHSAGFRTRSYNEGGFVAARFGFDRGFELYEELDRSLVSRASLLRIVKFIRSAGDEPYLLFLHTYAAHFPYGGYEDHRAAHPERHLPTRDELIVRAREAGPGGPEDGSELHRLCTLYNQLASRHAGLLGCGDNRPGESFRSDPHFEQDLAAIVKGYEARIRRVDAAVGAIRDALVASGQWDDTLLVVTSDHGDAFYEHGLYRHAFVPFDEVMRVPLIISFPALAEQAGTAGSVIEGGTSHLDLLPTLLALSDVPVPAGLKGQDLSPVLWGEQGLPIGRTVHAATLRVAQQEQEPKRRIVVQGRYKMIEGHPEFGDEEGLLFDLDADPGERSNLRSQMPDVFSRLLRASREYDQGLETRPPFDQRTGLPLREQDGDTPTAHDIGADELERLRSLGYAD
jgi:arylsulfatase A-like enzyme